MNDKKQRIIRKVLKYNYGRNMVVFIPKDSEIEIGDYVLIEKIGKINE